MKRVWLSFIVFAFFTGSCASGPKADIKKIDWKSRLGTYTYEEALAEFGKPDVISETSEGMIAEWVLRRSPMISFDFGVGSAGYGHHGSAGGGVGTTVSPPPSGEYLHLRFDREGTLVESSRVRY